MHSGHGFFIYDVEKDIDGKVVDAIFIQSGYGGTAYISTKIPREVGNAYPNGENFVHSDYTLYFNKHLNSDFKEGGVEGSISMIRISNYPIWIAMNDTRKRTKEYTVLRFIQSDSKGNAVLKYTNIINYTGNKYKYDDIMELSKRNQDKVKFRHLYIEKIVNKKNFNIVEIGDILIYCIIVKNNYTEKYKDDIIVTEKFSEFVRFQTYNDNKKNIEFEMDLKNRQLKWNIGKLEKGEEVNIYYAVQIISGKPYDVIESTGYVGNIKSSTTKNTIGINLNENQKN